MKTANNEHSVLVVDDDDMMRLLLKAILRSEEYPIAGEASNGKDAIALCAKLKPGVILLDIDMPGMDGLETLKAIRQGFPAVKVIMVSAMASMEKVEKAIEEGAIGFVVKPFNAAGVLDTIRTCIKGQ